MCSPTAPSVRALKALEKQLTVVSCQSSVVRFFPFLASKSIGVYILPVTPLDIMSSEKRVKKAQYSYLEAKQVIQVIQVIQANKLAG